MLVRQCVVSHMRNFGYLLVDEASHEAAVIDPSMDARPLEAEAQARGARITHILVTHAHYDHVQDLARLAAATGAKVCAHASSPLPVDLALGDGDVVRFGGSSLRVLHTPGHCPDACCFVGSDCVFTGDTLFVGECGRVDLPGSDVEAMHASLTEKLRGLPDALVVYPGHDYGPTPTSTIGHEKAHNYTMAPRTREEFVRFMRE